MADPVSPDSLSQRFARFARVNPSEVDGSVTIRPSAIYILPTRFGLLFASATVLMLIGSINYANNLGFLLTFFLGGLGMVSMVHTWRNLNGLRLRPLRAEPIFAGQTACLPFLLEDPTQRLRPDIELHLDRQHMAAIDLIPGQENRLQLEPVLRRRGHYRVGRCTLVSRFPMGLFRAWSYLQPQMSCLVYPRPEPWPFESALRPSEAREGQRAVRDPGGQEFHGLRQYQPGDPLKSIHWRSLARGMELMSREFESSEVSDLWFDLEQTPGPDLESRLRQLCHAVVTTAARNQRFGLRLGSLTLPPDLGDAHLANALRQLAEFGLSP
jgi:uncharacterized protein (DUF58 family)